ncbi:MULTISPECIES: DUF2777 family protein [Bacillaceae]|jgi:hypothetical protein|uniref:DUF2777 family protein n=1 Tax=Bacillaceae TaxID=186817 RepID=UPI00101C8494|nr:DUF2777 family protein [Ectobacillus funiculus]
MKHRYHIMRNQPRSYTVGNIECINEEWIFFDEESDEASLLWEIVEDDFEILYNNHWLPARFYENDTLKIENEPHPLESGETVRIRKKLQTGYEEWLKELSDSSFSTLTKALGRFDYSLYDCIYCHNILFFQPASAPRQGVNFIVYDNGDYVCSLHHRYIRDGEMSKDIFEFTRADGQMYKADC